MKVSHLTNSGARLIYSTAPHSRRRPWHVSHARQDTEIFFQMEVVKIEELLYDLSALLHVREISVTPPSFPPPKITMTSSNLGQTVSLIVVKGRLGAAQSVNATQINQRFTSTHLFVPLLMLSSSRKGAQFNGSGNEDTRTSRTFASISAFRETCVCQTVQMFLLIPTTCVRCWQSGLCFRVQEHWDSSRFSQSNPPPPHKLSAHYSRLLVLLQSCFKPPLPTPLLPQSGRMRTLHCSVSAVFQNINEVPRRFLGRWSNLPLKWRFCLS